MRVGRLVSEGISSPRSRNVAYVAVVLAVVKQIMVSQAGALQAQQRLFFVAKPTFPLLWKQIDICLALQAQQRLFFVAKPARWLP